MMDDDSQDGTSANVFAMRNRQSLLEAGPATGGAPPPAFMYKPGSADENAGTFAKAFKKLTSQWKKRRVIVNPAMFQYEDPESGKVVGVLRCAEVSAAKMINRSVMKDRGCPDNLVDYGWILVASGRQYVFACESAVIRDNWVAYLASMVRQRADDQLEDGDGDGTLAGTSLSYAQSRVARSSFEPGYANETIAGPSDEAQLATNTVFDSIRAAQSQKFRGGSNDGDYDDEGGGGLQMQDQEEFEEEESADTEILVERGDELVAVTIEEKKKVDPSEILAIPAPNAAYRRENVVIEALFEDLRTVEPDHVRLSQLETPASTLSYFQPHLLRAAQDNDLPGDLPPKPLFVSEYLENADSQIPPLRNSCISTNKIPTLVQGIAKMDLVMRMPNYKGISFVVDADGMIVGGPSISSGMVTTTSNSGSSASSPKNANISGSNISSSNQVGNNSPRNDHHNAMIAQSVSANAASAASLGAMRPTQYEISKMILARHSAANVFQSTTGAGANVQRILQSAAKEMLFGGVNANASITMNSLQQMAAAATGTSSSAQQHQQAQQQMRGNSKPTTPNTPMKKDEAFPTIAVSSATNSPAHNQQKEKGERKVEFPSAPPIAGGDDSVVGAGGGGLRGFLNQSIHALTHRRGGGGSNLSHASATVSQASPGAGGGKGEGASPCVYGPVITIETTRRRITVADMSYRSDTFGSEHNAPPPLFLITSVDLATK